jgi:hypothetical protein
VRDIAQVLFFGFLFLTFALHLLAIMALFDSGFDIDLSF